MVETDYQIVINSGFALWLTVLSFLGVRHHNHDVKKCEEILEILAALQETLSELRAEIDRLRQ